MPQDINKPTGLGYQGTWGRQCTQCGHSDQRHYGKACYEDDCECLGFAARPLDLAEIELIRDPPMVDETKYLDEAWRSELHAEIARQRGAPIMKV